MSAPPGHNAETSLLQGGDSVPIQAQQGGGNENISTVKYQYADHPQEGGQSTSMILGHQSSYQTPTPRGGQSLVLSGMLEGGEEVPIQAQQGGQINPDEIFTEKEKERIAKASITPMILAQAMPGATDHIIEESAKKGAEIEIGKIHKEREEGDKQQIVNDASINEQKAAKQAIDFVSKDPQFLEQYRDPTAQADVLQDVAFKAVQEERKKRGIKVVRTKMSKGSKGSQKSSSSIDLGNVNEINKKYLPTTFTIKKKLEFLKDTPVGHEFYGHPETIPADSTYTLSDINKRLNRIQNPEQNDTWMVSARKDVENYKRDRRKRWESINTTTDGKVTPILPMNNIKQISKNEIFTQFSRYIHCLPVTTESIIIISPIRGDILKFHKVINRLQSIKAITYEKRGGKDVFEIKPHTILIFMPSFFIDIEQTSVNILMFSLFLDLHRYSPDQVFLLSQSSAENYTLGKLLSKQFGDENYEDSANLLMLEPTYIIYPYARPDMPKGIVISGSTKLENVNIPLSSYSLEDHKYSRYYGKQVNMGFKPSPNTDNEPFEEGGRNMFTIRSFKDEKFNNKDNNTRIKLQKTHTGVKSCEGLLAGATDLFKHTDAFHVDTVDVVPEAKDIDPVETKDIIFVLRLNPKGTYVPLCKENPIQQGGGNTKFIPSRDLATTQHEQVEINGAVFNLRIAINDVKSDWLAGKFTKDEAEFLNSLHLSPDILKEIFSEETGYPNGYPKELTDFLTTLVNSGCLTDQSLLMKRECEQCRMFLEKVNSYFLEISLDRDLFEDDCNRPKERPRSSITAKRVDEPGVEAHEEPVKGAKRVWKQGTLNSFVKQSGGSVRQRVADILGVNSENGTSKWYSIYVPQTPDKLADEKAIQAKIETLRDEYPHIKFIY